MSEALQSSDYQQGMIALEQGNFSSAQSLFENAATSDPQNPEIVSKLGVSKIQQGNIDDAIQDFKNAIRLDTNFLPAYNNLVLLFFQTGRFEEVETYCQEAMKRWPQVAFFYNALGKYYRDNKRTGEAKNVFEQALEKCEADAGIYQNYGMVLFDLGDKEAAIDAYQKAISLNSLMTESHRMVSLCKKYKIGDEQEKVLTSLLSQHEQNLHPQQIADIQFTLGKIYEDQGGFEQSFSHFKVANDVVKSIRPFNIEPLKSYADDVRRVFSQDTSDVMPENPGKPVPIFIVGMPRSGTSLVEQILASHSKVYGAGELNTFEQALASEAIGKNAVSLDRISNVGDYYLEKTSFLVDGEEGFVTDKMPYNFQYIGFIKRAMPQAKIIHCVRDPRDVWLSMYRLFFPHSEADFSYDMNAFAEYYGYYKKIMAFWREIFSSEIYDISYEGLIENPKEEIEELLSFCGLGWQDGCMEFFKTDRAVMTASAMQVKQPLYKSSIGAWKNYEPYIGELLEALGT